MACQAPSSAQPAPRLYTCAPIAAKLRPGLPSSDLGIATLRSERDEVKHRKAFLLELRSAEIPALLPSEATYAPPPATQDEKRMQKIEL
ncbi:hypothetical protein Q5P01_025246 [Channa striata]|uniref:Uncharacterized protein n=1 Tax=Channa striata TaxID=64152 RepID=A0AA88IMZ6_CHASR|nr:hypothetical protein Q5P01_025246 [Channa striata]